MKKLTLKQQAELAPKYVLYIEGAGYISEKAESPDCAIAFTFNISEAIQYSIGFDNPNMKVGYWRGVAKAFFGHAVDVNIENVGDEPFYLKGKQVETLVLGADMIEIQITKNSGLCG
jgi:hypothetical protein